MHRITKFWPYLSLLVLVVLIGLLNYHIGTILTGGDNLHPEYNFPLNIRRSLFAVWQEYQGLGLLGGMGHASDLLHQLFLWLLSLLLPIDFLRYFYTFLTLFIGACGAYKLIAYLMNNEVRSMKYVPEEDKTHTSYFIIHTSLLPLLGASYYLLNLSTVQSYYTPFEVFTGHFASLPWILWSATRLLREHSPRSLLLFVLIMILSTPAAYVPTLFVVVLMALGILGVVLVGQEFIHHRHSGKRGTSASRISPHREDTDSGQARMTIIKGGIKLFILVFLINAFWLLPFAFFTITKSQVNVNAKINQMATETIFLLNKESGGIRDAMLLKGFWFNNVEPNFQGINTYMLQDWRGQINNPLVQAVGYLLFAVIFTGFLQAVRHRRSLLFPFAIVGVVMFCMLVTATPPFSWINLVTREYLPLFSQVFRFPFTKFSILTSLIYAIFFTVGASFLLNLLRTKLRSSHTLYATRYSPLTLCAMLFALCLIFVFPIFQGHLFYDKERLTLPSSYQQLTNYLNEKENQGRIANFPVNTFWDWKFYSWGYSGSGFLWYGIENPILDRAFDMFSKENENAYYELSQAVYAKDPIALNNVLQKYQVRWILFDRSVSYPQSPKSLFYPENEALFSQIPSIKKAKDFGDISLYEVRLTDHPTSFVFASSNLPTVNSYDWIDADSAYAELGGYQTTTKNPDLVYPFRSLFSLKTQPELSYSMTEEDSTLTLTSQETIPDSSTLRIPSFLSTEKSIAGRFVLQKQKTGLILSLQLLLPEVWVGNTKVAGSQILHPLIQLPASFSSLKLNVNGQATYTLSPTEGTVGTVYLPLQEDSILTISSGKTVQNITLPHNYYTTLPQLTEQTVRLTQGGQLHVILPKIDNPAFSFVPDLSSNTPVRNCDYFRPGTVSASYDGALTLSATDATACIAYYTYNLNHVESYALFVKAANTKGRSLHTWILNEDEKYAPLETYLPENSDESISTFILPPQDPFGKAYSVHFDADSIGHDPSINSVEHVAMYPISYGYLTHLVATTSSVSPAQTLPPLTVTHPNESLYTVTDLPATASTLILSQGFDKGWQAFHVQSPQSNVEGSLMEILPFLFGKRLEHVEVNNWENGWKMSPGETQGSIILFYLPQYLEWIGFACLLLALLWTGISFFRREKQAEI